MTVFSPEGSLYQIEYALKAADIPGYTSIGVRGEDCVVFVTQKKVQDKLVDASSVSNMYALTPKIGSVFTGIAPDSRAWAQKARQIAAEFEYDNGYPIPVSYLATKIADDSQVYTQYSAKRTLASYMILGGVDDEAGPQLYLCDPAGVKTGYKACAAGPKTAEATSWLEKEAKKGAPADVTAALRRALLCIQSVHGTDYKASDLEVAVATAEEPFKLLGEEEVEAHLTAIAEED